jgi:hypothetical protein
VRRRDQRLDDGNRVVAGLGDHARHGLDRLDAVGRDEQGAGAVERFAAHVRLGAVVGRDPPGQSAGTQVGHGEQPVVGRPVGHPTHRRVTGPRQVRDVPGSGGVARDDDDGQRGRRRLRRIGSGERCHRLDSGGERVAHRFLRSTAGDGAQQFVTGGGHSGLGGLIGVGCRAQAVRADHVPPLAT